MTSVETGNFTAEQANRTLPLVGKITADILRAGNAMKSMSRQTMTGEHAALLETRIAELKSYLKELDDLGCSFKDWDFKTGLIEFPGELDGEPVVFSWRSDEESVNHYHRIDESHQNRRRIPPAS